jgi:hypothetical protein
MQNTRKQIVISAFFLLFGVFSAGVVWGDPLPGEILKFQQQPMIATTLIDPNGAPVIYYGHDELSTAWNYPGYNPGVYRGNFMADDFADNFSTPVVHVSWWGSYIGANPAATPQVQKFLIAFESDIPVDATNPWSKPGTVLNSQVVTLSNAPLLPASGNFTEKLVAGSSPNEPVYKYNAELSLPFNQAKDTVYWLKIVALDDVVGGAVPIQWGWHNRDYTLNDLALASPVPSPGETNLNPLDPTLPVWHFQDDAVQGHIDVGINTTGTISINQFYVTPGDGPMNYLAGVDGPLNTAQDIGRYSKDLAFELYTPVPEPGALTLLGMCGLGLAAYAWRKCK